MPQQDPGNHLYKLIYDRVYPETPLGGEKAADVIEGVFGLYLGLKRAHPNKRKQIAGQFGNLWHLADTWLHYVDKAVEVSHDSKFLPWFKDYKILPKRFTTPRKPRSTHLNAAEAS